MNLFNLPRIEEEAVAFLQEKEVISISRKCRRKHEMKLSFGSETFWRCRQGGCNQD
jgi:hypothetical protein